MGASVRSAAQSALQAGFLPMGTDLFADADLTFGGPWKQVVDYPAGLTRELDRFECDGWMYTGGLENYPAQVAAMAARYPLLGCGGKVLQQVRSPQRLAAVLEAADLRYPRTVPLPEADRLVRVETGVRWLVKTCRGSSGMGVRPLRSRARHAQTSTIHGDGYLQQRIDGNSCAALFLAGAEQTILVGLTRQLVGESWTGAAPFQYCGSIGPYPQLPVGVFAEVERIGQVLAKAFSLIGLFGVDLILASNQVWTIEVNPRYTAAVEIVERVLGMPLLDRHVRACQQQVGGQALAGSLIGLCQSVGSSGCHGKVVLFARQRVTIERKFTEWALAAPCQEGWPQLADIPRPGTVIEPGQPVVTLFAAAESVVVVEEALRARVAQTQRKLYGAPNSRP